MGRVDVGDRRAAKDRLFAALASTAKALGNGRRAELIDVLVQGPRAVQDLAGEIGQSIANTSQHLHVLLDAGLVTTSPEGTRVIYALASDDVRTLWLTLRSVSAAHVDRIDDLARDYVGDRSSLGAMTRDELERRLEVGDVVVLDVRPRPEFLAGHIAGAVHIAPAEVRERLAALPEGSSYVAYCRGPFCVYADDAVRALGRAGRSAVRFEGGFPEWVTAGGRVETGEPATPQPPR